MIGDSSALAAAAPSGSRLRAAMDVSRETKDAALLASARALEAAFLAEMLKHSGVGEAPEGFGGGIGEEQFAGFLREAQAKEMARAGGIGLAEHIFRSLRMRGASDV